MRSLSEEANAASVNGDLTITDPIAPGIREESLVSPADNTRQTWLTVEFGQPSPGSAPVLVAYLHGALCHQEQGMTAGIFHNAFGRLAAWMQRRPTVYLCPEYRGNSWMGPAAERDLVEILRQAKSHWRPASTLLIGGSMGGTSALIFAARHPECVNGVLAFCPATDPAEMFARFPDHFRESYGGSPEEVPEVYRERTTRWAADRLANLPLAIVHGTADDLIPVEHSRRLVTELRRRNARLRYVEMPRGGHNSPLEVDAGPLLNFLLDSAWSASTKDIPA